jgi:sulfur-oxidizing protein SoxX
MLALGSFSMTTQIASAADEATMVEKGKAVAFDRKKGNCLACHKIAGGDLPGNIGPELVNMQARYPDKAKLRAKIWDATSTPGSENTIMPPFGKHKIVSEQELDAIVEFIYSL